MLLCADVKQSFMEVLPTSKTLAAFLERAPSDSLGVVHSKPGTLNSKHCTLDTKHTMHCTLNTKRSTLNTKRSTLITQH